MKAALLREYGQPLVIDEMPDPVVSDSTDVIVQVAGAGVCGSDVHLRDGMLVETMGRWDLPYILGHETAGHVVEVGSAVNLVKPGDPVLLHPLISCGLCLACRSGQDMYCENARFPGIDGMTSGGFAERIKTGVRTLVPLPAGSDPVPMAPFADAGLTAYHVVKKLVGLVWPGTRVLVIGVGGVGDFVVQLLNTMTPAEIFAADIVGGRLDRAKAHGALETYQVTNDADIDKWPVVARDGVDVVVDCAGGPETAAAGFKVLKRGGVYSAVAAGIAPIPLSTERAAGRELSLIGNYVGSYRDLWELLELHAVGKTECAEVRYALDDAEQALSEVANGLALGRAVLVP